jgi:2-oxoglutarate dehydrogenase E2 component (dihydrolipoamide succinyltransferase)
MSVELKVPSVGESISEVEIGEWLKKEGDSVKRDETLVVLQSEKTAVEVPSPFDGVLTSIAKREGDTAHIGDVLALIDEGAGASSGTRSDSQATKSAASAPEWKEGESAKMEDQSKGVTPQEANPSFGVAGGGVPNDAETAESALGADGGAKTHLESQTTVASQTPEEAAHQTREHESNGAASFVMPAAERVLAENNLQANQVAASGPNGRLLKEDVLRHVEGQQQSSVGSSPETAPQTTAPQVATTSSTRSDVPTRDDEELVPMSFLRRKVAERLVEAQQTAALLTTFNEIDMTNVMSLRKEHQDQFVKKHGVKLGFMSFFVKASVDALKQIPGVNAEIRGKDIVYKNHYDIGVAIGGGKGLVVPVLKGADRLSFSEIEKNIGDFATRAKDGKLLPDELTGGTFTITNGGIYGSLMSTPIVNAPQSGILGMHSIQERPIALNGQVVIRPMMYIALTYDHRLVDGREAVTFLVRIKECIENPTRMLMEV